MYTNNGQYDSAISQFGKFGLRDKTDQGSGISQNDPLQSQFTTLENTIVLDTRDCVGIQSLDDAKSFAVFEGIRGQASGNILSVSGFNPMLLTFNSTNEVKNGDKILFSKMSGITAVNNTFVISNVQPFPLNTVEINTGTNGIYQGGGRWFREADSGYPELKNTDSTVIKNVITLNLNKELKQLRSLSIFHVVIPRDIIPIENILLDFIPLSTLSNNIVYSGIATNDFSTFIPQEKAFMESRTSGFYSSPIDLWRSYEGSTFSMQSQVTPPPLNLWNPPSPGVWPLQPIPYPFQTVPTYRSNNFTIPGKTGNFYIVLGGYGVYDLVDWTIDTGDPVNDIPKTAAIRKLLIYMICPIQSYKGVDYIDLLLNCNTVTVGNNNPVQAYGFGDFQRYVCGPGLGQNYQPGTNSTYNTNNLSGPPNVVQPDSFISFPNFRGNVWGPYTSPGDHFQKLGLRETLQDLYLNGDLINLLGSPIINPNVPTEAIPYDSNFGLNFPALIPVNFGNIQNTTNPNILNAMRITPNGFGAAVFRAEGYGTFYNNIYNNTAGGIGPSNLGTPGGAWVNNGIYGAGSFKDPIAQGYATGTNTTSASTSADSGLTGPTSSPSYFDFGPDSGNFRKSVQSYIGYCVNDIPDNDLIVRVEEAKREERAQSTNTFNSDALLDVPIRLNLGSVSGTIQYIESLQSLLAQATGYWQQRFFNGKDRLSSLHFHFYDYSGNPVPLEKMLQPREVLQDVRDFTRLKSGLKSIEFNPFVASFLFNPINPQLIGRTKRYIQFILKSDVYSGTPPGLEPTSSVSNTYI